MGNSNLDFLIRNTNAFKQSNDYKHDFINLIGELGHVFFFGYITHDDYARWLYYLSVCAVECYSKEKIVKVCDLILDEINSLGETQ